jgi:tyrosyl-tRNA synthetase
MKNNNDNGLLRILENVDIVAPKDDLKKKLESGKRLNIKLGADPTAPDLHLGHAVVLEKMKDFQDLKHNIVFLIGDFTSKIGDPSGKSKTRIPLTDDQIKKNAKTYFKQVGKILDISKTTIVYNSHWLANLKTEDWVKIFSRVTLSRVIERDDFKTRLQSNSPIAMHEVMYSLMQAYDSVYLEADIELGGTDQLLNLMMGRTLQERFDQEPQIAITMPLLIGLDGVNKMSKSLNNYIGLTEDPKDVFGKIMSISDDLMWSYYKVLFRESDKNIVKMKSEHPMECKKNLARRILDKYWGSEFIEMAEGAFRDKFEDRSYKEAPVVALCKSEYNVIDLIVFLSSDMSRSDVRRLIDGGGLKLNDEKISDKNFIYKSSKNDIIKIGKLKIYRIEF